MGWRWSSAGFFACLLIQATFILSQEENELTLNDLILIEENEPAFFEEPSHIHKRDAGCIFEPEIIPEGSEQFGIRLKPLKTKSTSFLEPAASTYRAAQYQPVRYNLPPLPANENAKVSTDYRQNNAPAKINQNPFSVSKYKATTPKYPLTTPETDDAVEPAGSGDVFEAIKPSTSAPEYLPPYQEPQTPAPSYRPTSAPISRQRLVQQPTQTVSYVNPAPAQPLTQNYLPPETAASNVDTVKQPFQNSIYYTPTVPTVRPLVSQSVTSYYFPTQRTTLAPIRVESLKNYLPPENAAPSNENPAFAFPSTTTQKPATQSNEYLPPESPESTNDNPAFLQPAQPKKPVDGLAGRFTTPDEHYHTLEELCNDPFHSFLCEPLKPRSKDRFKNRNSKKVNAGNIPDASFVQPRVVAPSTTISPPTNDQPLVPASSFQDITRTKLPEEKHDCDKSQPIVAAASFNQAPLVSKINVSYLPPVSTTTTQAPTTTAAPQTPPTGLYAKNPFSELVFQSPIKQAAKPQPFVAKTYLQPQTNAIEEKPVLPQPSNNQFSFIPRQFPSTTKPLKIPDYPCNKHNSISETPAASSVSENVQGYNYPQPQPPFPQPAASNIVTTGYNYPQPAASTAVLTGYSYPQPSPSTTVTTGYNYPVPAASSLVSTGYEQPQPSPSTTATTGYNYPVPAASSLVSTGYEQPQQAVTGYSYPQPNPTFNEIPQASNEQPTFSGYQYPVPAFNQQYLQPAASINYFVPSARPAVTTTTTSAPSTTTASSEPKDDEFPPLNSSHFTFLPGEVDEISNFKGYTTGRPQPSAVPEKVIGYGAPKNDTSLQPAADTNFGYYYPSPQPAPAASANVESFQGYSYPSPSNNQPVFETTPKTDGYDYPAPLASERLSLPSNFFSQKVKLPLEEQRSSFQKEDCDKRPHSLQVRRS